MTAQWMKPPAKLAVTNRMRRLRGDSASRLQPAGKRHFSPRTLPEPENRSAQRDGYEPGSRRHLRHAVAARALWPGRRFRFREAIRIVDSRPRFSALHRVFDGPRGSRRRDQHRFAKSNSEREFMAILRKAWGTRIGLPASAWMLELGAVFLRTETELILKSRRVIPGRLLAHGFEFDFQRGVLQR